MTNYEMASTLDRCEEENFRVGRSIGSGAFSVVKMATHIRTKQLVALKILDGKKIEELAMTAGWVHREIDNLRLCAGHPHIVRLYDVFDGSAPGDIILVTEYARDGTLYDHLTEQKKRRLPYGEAKLFFRQITSGLDFMHKHGVAHRDLTLDNILMDDDRSCVKLADFGFSKFVGGENERAVTSCGSPNYAAPELLAGTPYDAPAVDVWSLGVVLYVMLTGDLPFDGDDVSDLFKKIRSGIYDVPRWLLRNARGIIQKMLEVDASTRVTVLGIRQSPFFRKGAPKYLDHAYTNRRNGVDAEVVNQLVKYYGTATDDLVTKKYGKPSDAVQVTKELVERVATAYRDYGDEDEQPYDLMRDLRLNYELLIDRKTAQRGLLSKKKKLFGSRNSVLGLFSILSFVAIVALVFAT